MNAHRHLARFWKKFEQDDAFLLSAAIAWGVLFSIVPFLALGIGLTGIVLSVRFDDPTEAVVGLFAQHLPPNAAGEDLSRALRGLVGEVMDARTGLTVAGAFLFVWLATRLSGTLRSTLATVFETSRRRNIVHGKLFDIGAVLIGVVLVTVNIGVTVIVTTMVQFGVGELSLEGDVISVSARAFGAVVAFLSIWTLFTMVYRYLPRERTSWRKTLIAATFAAFLHEVLKFGFSWYVTEVANYQSTLGNLATTALVLLWIYYEALVFILGGEVAQVYSVREAS